MELVVGVDVATARVRAMAAAGDGAARAEASVALPAPSSPRPGWSEQDAATWWPAVATVLSDLTTRLGDERHAIVAMAVCATSGTVVALDGDGDPLGPALLYSDQRAKDEADVAQAAGAERWERLGLRVQPSFGLPKMAWLARHHEAVHRLVHVPDVVAGRLTGRVPPTDWSHALKSGYDPDRQEWATEALEAVGLSPTVLPRVLSPAERAGTVSAEAASLTGLPATCEVRLGMTDACASQLAAGASEPGEFVSVLGSTLAIKGASRELVADPAGSVYSHRHPDGWWMPGGASSTGARSLEDEFAHEDLASLDERAARHGPATTVTYPLTGTGERFPFTVTDARAFWLGEPDDQVDRYRAMLEGVAFVERLSYERLAALGAPAREPIVLAGGGSRSRVWNAIRAGVLGRAAVAKPAATTARGACILAAAGTVHPDLATATRAMAVSGEDVEPAPGGEREALESNYQRFVDALAERGWWPPAS